MTGFEQSLQTCDWLYLDSLECVAFFPKKISNKRVFSSKKRPRKYFTVTVYRHPNLLRSKRSITPYLDRLPLKIRCKIWCHFFFPTWNETFVKVSFRTPTQDFKTKQFVHTTPSCFPPIPWTTMLRPCSPDNSQVKCFLTKETRKKDSRKHVLNKLLVTFTFLIWKTKKINLIKHDITWF